MQKTRPLFRDIAICMLLMMPAFILADQKKTGESIVSAARDQVGKTIIYDSAYVVLDYPGGDVPIERGVCTDVVVRALRDSLKMDLQQLVHEDMKKAFDKYPKNWDLKRPDKHIDHRRVQNLQCYFKRKGFELELTDDPENYLPGDIVSCMLENGMAHIVIVSDKRTSDGLPYIIHNIGRGAREEYHLFVFKLTGHYRIKVEESES